jgi:hypothetical protein
MKARAFMPVPLFVFFLWRLERHFHLLPSSFDPWFFWSFGFLSVAWFVWFVYEGEKKEREKTK